MNEKMKELFEINAEIKTKIKDDDIKRFCENVVSKTKLINNCVIYDDSDILNEDEIDFDWIFRKYIDRTGYETSCNEIRIFDYLLSKDVNENIINTLLKGLKNELLKKFKREFCIIITSDNDIMTLRFHSYRKNEGIWLSENLDGYDEPTLYEIFRNV